MIIPPNIQPGLQRIASRFRQATGRTLFVTSGTRTAAGQASAMLTKIRAGASMADYSQALLRDVMVAYREGVAAHESDQQIADRMTRVIEQQMRNGNLISPHLSGRAIDVRTRDLSPAENRTLQEIAVQEGVRPHPEGRPPHLHLTFPRR